MQKRLVVKPHLGFEAVETRQRKAKDPVARSRLPGTPAALLSDHSGVFLDHRVMQIYMAVGIQKKEIDKRQSWQNLIETAFPLLGITSWKA